MTLHALGTLDRAFAALVAPLIAAQQCVGPLRSAQNATKRLSLPSRNIHYSSMEARWAPNLHYTEVFSPLHPN